MNQVWLVNVNMGGRPGPGRSVIVDPEGHLLQQAGDGEEYQTEVLDLDAVIRVREHGSVGLNRMSTATKPREETSRCPSTAGRCVPFRGPSRSGPEPARPGSAPEHDHGVAPHRLTALVGADAVVGLRDRAADPSW